MKDSRHTIASRLLLVLVCLVALAVVGQRKTASPVESVINVRDFGAVGDGVTDDTDAIRRAFEPASDFLWPIPVALAVYQHQFTPVVFPPGKYRISDSIKINNTTILGQGATIEQVNPDKDIFVHDQAWRMSINGLSFYGGRHHLNLSNPNIDSGMIQIKDCRFQEASGVAINFDTQSTTLDIDDCVFMVCMQVLVIRNGGDQTIMRDCWITTHKDMKDMAVIVNKGGRLTIENLCGVPLVNGSDQRWIDNHGQWLSATQCRFGGEGGGFTPVVNYAKPLSYPVGSMVFIEDSLICAVGNNKRQTAVYCEEIPNHLVVRDCTLYVPEVMVRPDIDPKTYFAGVKKQMVRIDVDNNCNVKGGESPAWLRDPQTASGPVTPTLSAAETKAALAKAVETISALPPADDGPYANQNHRQQTDPAKYISINARTYKWDLSDDMDGTTEPNGDFLSVAPAGDSVVLLRRRPAGNSWPHARIRNVTIDLDKTPILTLKLRDIGRGTADSTALKVLDAETQRMVVLGEFYSGFYQYRAFDLRKHLELTGKRTLELKFYYLGDAWKHPKRTQTGDYILLQFLRAEANNPQNKS